ncbi:MAG: ethylbenzene dehydrogenase-related protein [Rhodoferax sp.]
MKKSVFAMAAMGALVAAAGSAWAAPDWGKAAKREITVFHPGVAPVEWVNKKSDHSGTAGLKKGETCVGCHEEKTGLNFNFKRLADKEMEPVGAPKTMSYPVTVQAAYDASNLYIRLSFKAPKGGANQGDKTNEVKATVLFPDEKVPLAAQAGCWASCHNDARTMPGADDKKTKYTKDGAYQLMQWASGKGAKVADGSVTSERKMDGGSLGAKAEGSKAGDTYTVTFTRKNPGEGKTVPFGVAIHADNASGRFHHVSLGYTIGIGAEGDLKATKQ